MKTFALVLAGLRLASALPQSQSDASSTTLDSPIPAGVFLQSRLTMDKAQTPGANMTKVRFGPYTLQPMQMLENIPVFAGLQLPCTECYITAMEAGLELEDGTSINIDQEAWLHHMVLYLRGNNRKDLVCGQGWFDYPERIFASGNERTPVRLNGKSEHGLKFRNGDHLMLIYDLVNNAADKRDFYITMMFEHLPAAAPEAQNYKEALLIWLDITDCGDSEEPAQTGVYSLDSHTYTSTVNGTWLTSFGHVHDGGQDVISYVNGQPFCSSVQFYGREAEFIEPANGMNPGLGHISDVGTCVDFPADLRVGDNLSVTAEYNTNKNPLNKMNNGQDQTIMGIQFAYLTKE